MRKKVKVIDKPSLKIHIDYNHLTVGELGNILIRLQAALRSIAGLSPGEYDGRYSREQPRFITSSINTGYSIDIAIILAILSLAASMPNAINNWMRITTEIFRRFKIALLAMVRGEIESEDNNIEAEGLRIEVTRGKIDLEASRPFLDELSPATRKALGNLIWSLTGPSRKVNIGDEESEISLQWPEDDEEEKF